MDIDLNGIESLQEGLAQATAVHTQLVLQKEEDDTVLQGYENSMAALKVSHREASGYI